MDKDTIVSAVAVTRRESLQPVDRRSWMKQAAGMVAGAATLSMPDAAAAAVAPPQAAQPASHAGVHVATPEAGVVETTSGKVRGFSRNGVYIFRGIPYGDTTGGANRFMPPKRPAAWAGVRSSTSWGPVSPHAPRGGWVNDEEQFLYQWDDGFAGEDMLRINVWTPGVNDAARRPVLVWIHGGGFTSGSSQELRPYDGERLARQHGAVLVSMNHRLNVFGFLDLSALGGEPYASSANVGQLDLVLALEWVRDNIARFGGDPASVTIFGQSGGGRKVSTLLAMPSAQGLFHRAAILSGAHLRQSTPDQSARLAAAVLEELNVSKSDIRRLHQVTTDELLNAGINAQRRVAAATPAGTPAPNWGPVVDGRVLPQHAFDTVASPLAANVPVLIGNTYVEFGGGANNPTAHELTFDQLRERLQPVLGARTGDAIAAYRKVFPAARPFEIWGVIQGTRAYRIPSVALADLKAAQAAPVFMYWFGWNTPVLDGRPLAFHCQDLAFWFDNIDLAAQATGGTDDARSLAAKMSGALVAFARSGNPNHDGLPQWPAYTPAARPTMVFENASVAVKQDPDRDARALVV
jgi:para-nitrobenzyl esterase